MRSPAEQTLQKADAKIERQRLASEKPNEKAVITENVDQALDYLPESTQLSDYVSADDQKLDLTIKRDGRGGSNSRGTQAFEINGQLTDLITGIKAELPMYRVSKKIPNSDTMGNLPGRYEISVADPDSETGYTTLGLVYPIAREHAPHVSGFDFGSKRNPTPDQVESLASDGYYKDPHSVAMLEEVHSILGMAVAQQMEAQVAVDSTDVPAGQ